MTLIDDTCDGCGGRFDPMGDPLLTKHPEIGPYAVFCAACQDGIPANEKHLPRALEMANERAERWRQRYNSAVRDLEAATEQLAEAWDEGYSVGWNDAEYPDFPARPNPYRKAE